MIGAHDLLKQIARCSHAMGHQSGVPAVDIAGHTLSILAANPEHIQRYMDEGNELWLDGTLRYEDGCLSYEAVNGETTMPSAIRATLPQ